MFEDLKDNMDNVIAIVKEHEWELKDRGRELGALMERTIQAEVTTIMEQVTDTSTFVRNFAASQLVDMCVYALVKELAPGYLED